MTAVVADVYWVLTTISKYYVLSTMSGTISNPVHESTLLTYATNPVNYYYHLYFINEETQEKKG